MNKLNISEEVLNKLITNVFNVQSEHNSNHIKNILLNSLSDHVKETILHLACIGKEYLALSVGDYVRVKPPSYHPGDEFEWDILEDMKLNPGGGYVYAKVLKDTSYKSEKNPQEFDPFHDRITVELLYHNMDREIKRVEHNFNPIDMVKVNEEDIGFFDIIHELDA